MSKTTTRSQQHVRPFPPALLTTGRREESTRQLCFYLRGAVFSRAAEEEAARPAGQRGRRPGSEGPRQKGKAHRAAAACASLADLSAFFGLPPRAAGETAQEEEIGPHSCCAHRATNDRPATSSRPRKSRRVSTGRIRRGEGPFQNCLADSLNGARGEAIGGRA